VPSSVAWSCNLGGLLQGVHPEIAAAVRDAAELLAAASRGSCQQAAPKNLKHAHGLFKVLRFSRNLDEVAGGPGDVSREWIAANGRTTKPELLWEFAEAKADGWQQRVAEAEHSRQVLEASFVHLLDVFDVLVCPCTLMHPFDKGLRYPARCSPPVEAPEGSPGWVLEDYIQWMLPCSVVSLTGLPAISVPVGFTPAGIGNGTSLPLPIGVQLVGRPGGEAALLAAAALLERAVAQRSGQLPKARAQQSSRPVAEQGKGNRPANRMSVFGDVCMSPVEPVPGRAAAATVAANTMAKESPYVWSGPRTEEEARDAVQRLAGVRLAV